MSAERLNVIIEKAIAYLNCVLNDPNSDLYPVEVVKHFEELRNLLTEAVEEESEEYCCSCGGNCCSNARNAGEAGIIPSSDGSTLLLHLAVRSFDVLLSAQLVGKNDTKTIPFTFPRVNGKKLAWLIEDSLQSDLYFNGELKSFLIRNDAINNIIVTVDDKELAEELRSSGGWISQQKIIVKDKPEGKEEKEEEGVYYMVT